MPPVRLHGGLRLVLTGQQLGPCPEYLLDRIEQVVSNLLNNAAKFTDRGGDIGLGPMRLVHGYIGA